MELKDFIEKINNSELFAKKVHGIYEAALEERKEHREVLDFLKETKGTIEMLTRDYAVVKFLSETEKAEYAAIYKDKGSWHHIYCRLDTLEEALLYAFAFKVEGFGSNGGKYLNAMLNGLQKEK